MNGVSPSRWRAVRALRPGPCNATPNLLPLASRLSPLALLAFLAVAACSSTGSTPPPGANGVNDVRKACEIRATWTRGTTDACGVCFGQTITPRCACSTHDFAGKCSEQQAAKAKEPTCDGIENCVTACKPTDCACIDGCYAGKACRVAASAVDGCTAEICAADCR